MHIVLIRHADPDYAIDSLTEKGWREAELLSRRVARWQVRDFYCSPLGRAKDTAGRSLKKLGRQAETLDWLREFPGYAIDEETGRHRCPWDYLPQRWRQEPTFYDRDKWVDSPLLAGGTVQEAWRKLKEGVDAFTAKYGYFRQKDGSYRTEDPCGETVVCFCHMAVQLAIAGYLTGVSPELLWHGFFVPTTGVTIVGTEEREQGIACFRVQTVGDTAHLYAGDEPVSRSGYHDRVITL